MREITDTERLDWILEHLGVYHNFNLDGAAYISYLMDTGCGCCSTTHKEVRGDRIIPARELIDSLIMEEEGKDSAGS